MPTLTTPQKIPCPHCTGGKVEPELVEAGGVYTMDDRCLMCAGEGWAHELRCAACGVVVSVLAGEDARPHVCDADDPHSYLCRGCRKDRDAHELRCLGARPFTAGVKREVA